jgi:DNA replication protein DnaC
MHNRGGTASRWNGTQFASLAEEASQQNRSHLQYLETLLLSEVEDRERRTIELRLKDAHLPRMKTLEDFDFAQSPHIPASRIRALAEGGYLARAEPVLLIGEPGTGKSHLATGLAIAACRQRKRVRFTTAAALVNQLVEAQREQSLSCMLARWSRVELIVIDELGYVPLAEVAAELLFQVIADRAEKAAIIVTTTCYAVHRITSLMRSPFLCGADGRNSGQTLSDQAEVAHPVGVTLHNHDVLKRRTSCWQSISSRLYASRKSAAAQKVTCLKGLLKSCTRRAMHNSRLAGICARQSTSFIGLAEEAYQFRPWKSDSSRSFPTI